MAAVPRRLKFLSLTLSLQNKINLNKSSDTLLKQMALKDLQGWSKAFASEKELQIRDEASVEHLWIGCRK